MLTLATVVVLLVNLALTPGPRLLAPDQQLPCPPCLDQLPTGARVLGVASAPTDASGLVETLVAYYVRDSQFPNLNIGRVGAIAVRAVGGRSEVHKLSEDLGEAPYAELHARDLTGDGTTELAIVGGVGAHSQLLRIFRWKDSGYILLDEFFADSGLNLRDVDGDGVDEVILGLRHYDRAQLRHDSTLRWNGSAYVVAYNRWGFTFDEPGFLDYPEAIVLRYYLAIAERDYRAAYRLLGPEMQRGQPYAVFEQGFAGTRDVRVEDLEVLKEDATDATVRVEISSVEREGAVRRFGGTWLVERSGAAWQLAGAYITPV